MINRRIFELDSKCPYLTVDTFTTNAEVDSFFQTNILDGITQLGSLHNFAYKDVLDYFSTQMTQLYPTIQYLDVLDKDIKTIEQNLSVIQLDKLNNNKNIETKIKIRFKVNEGRDYFTSDLNTLLNYVPLIFPVKPNCSSIMLIDYKVNQSHIFYDSANSTTLPVLFNSNTLRREINDMLQTYTMISRVCIVANNKNMYNDSKLFINGETYFTARDVEANTTNYSHNLQFMLDLIKTYNIKTIDFLACESLTYTNWKQYYAILSQQGCTIGASSDKTGNIAYGGDWIMESDNQNIQPVYFTDAIQNYHSTLFSNTIFLGFGPYGNDVLYGQTNIITSEFDTSYNLSNYTLTQDIHDTTVSIYNTFPSPISVTVYLTDMDLSGTNLYGYNIHINGFQGFGTNNGSNVIIDGSNAYFNYQNYTQPAFTDDHSFITIVNYVQLPLVGIELNNIIINVDTHSIMTTNGNNYAWIYSNANIVYATNTTLNNCNVICDGSLNLTNLNYSGIIYANGNNYTTTTTYGITTTNNTSIITNDDQYQGVYFMITGTNIVQNTIILDISLNNTGQYVITMSNPSLNKPTPPAFDLSNNSITTDTSGNFTLLYPVSGLTVGQSVTFTDNIGSFNQPYFISSTDGHTIFTLLDNINQTIISNNTIINSGLMTLYDPLIINGNTITFNSCSVTSNEIILNDSNSFCGIIGSGKENTNANGGILTFNLCSVTSDTIICDGFNNGIICGGGNNTNGNGGIYTFNSCSVVCNNELEIANMFSRRCGIICGGGNNTSNGNGGTYTFNSCSVVCNNGLTINSDAIANGIICGGHDNSVYGNGGIYAFNGCYVSVINGISINNYNSTQGSSGIICGGALNSQAYGGSYSFTSCSVNSVNGISISNSSHFGLICGGVISQASTTNNGIYTFKYCLVTCDDISFNGMNLNCGIICGGRWSVTNGIGSIYTFTLCTVNSINGINFSTTDMYNGIISGGDNNHGDTGVTYTFNACSVTCNTILLCGFNNGVICGGMKNENNNIIPSSYTFNSCQVICNNDITNVLVIDIDNIDYRSCWYNGIICGGGNSTNGSIYTFNSCITTSNNIIFGNSVYNTGIISGGQQQLNYYYGSGDKYIFNTCLVNVNNRIDLQGGVGWSGLICGGSHDVIGNNYTLNSCSVICNDISFNYPQNSGIISGGAKNGSDSIHTFNYCSVMCNGIIELYNNDNYYINNVGIICGSGDYAPTNIYNFNACSVIVATYITNNTIIIASDGSFNYISDTSTTTTDPPTIADNYGLIYGDPSTGVYLTPSLLIVASDMRTIFTSTYKNVFTNYNLCGIDLSGVDLTNYNLSNVMLTNTNFNNVNFTNTLITDGVAIASNIVRNSGLGITPENMYIIDNTVDVTYGLQAFRRGISNQSKPVQQSSVAQFVGGIYTALNSSMGFNSNTIVTIASNLLPRLIPWTNSYNNTNVQLINASIYPIINNNYTPVTNISLNEIPVNTCQYVYTLIQNYPDTVNTYDVCGNILTISAVGPYNNDLSQVTLTQIPGGTHPFPPPSNGFTVVNNNII